MNPTDLEMTYPETYRILKRQSKPDLVAMLVNAGTVYPTRAQLLRLPKEELISMLLTESA